MTEEGDRKHWIIQGVYNSNSPPRAPRCEARGLKLKYQTKRDMGNHVTTGAIEDFKDLFKNHEQSINFFSVLGILTFFYYANEISDDVTLFAAKKWKIRNKRYLWKY